MGVVPNLGEPLVASKNTSTRGWDVEVVHVSYYLYGDFIERIISLFHLHTPPLAQLVMKVTCAKRKYFYGLKPIPGIIKTRAREKLLEKESIQPKQRFGHRHRSYRAGFSP